ncbi:MAG: threonylcarbamoyl-AMP synthase [Ignavibacteriales bacterium]|nr:MAG: threonylcarbamoyl-AMP synthase [Ignavibacteriales bacterium]
MFEINKAELVNIDKDFDSAVERVCKLFMEGKIFVYPTDTLYGFGANPFNDDAVMKISRIKSREEGKMYILLINNIKNLSHYVNVQSEKHWDFLLSLWPNPVSVVLKLNSRTRNILGIEIAAFRIPNHRFCQKILDRIQMPLISTSVNRSNKPPLREFSEIRDEFSGDVDGIFYTEKRSFFEASTLLDLTGEEPVLLREGKIKFSDILPLLGKN